jgi:hypothetical protein
MADGFVVSLRPMLRATRTPPNWRGNGYLAGEYPEGITTVEGVPTSADVLVCLRLPGSYFDGLVVARTVSAPDGTWRVDGLSETMRFDVRARKEGRNGALRSDVQPKIDP